MRVKVKYEYTGADERDVTIDDDELLAYLNEGQDDIGLTFDSVREAQDALGPGFHDELQNFLADGDAGDWTNPVASHTESRWDEHVYQVELL